MQKKTIIVDVETDDGVKSLNRLEASFEDVYGEIQPLTGRLGELEDQLYEMATAGQKGTKEFNALAAEVAKMKKTVVEVDMAVDGMSGTMSQKLGGAVSGLAGGFELAQGAMGAFGAESAKVEEALLKVNSAMAIAQGVQSVKESIPAFKALNAVIMANPIVAVVTAFIALGTAAMAWASKVSTKVVDAFNNQAKAAEDYRKNLSRANDEQNKNTEKALKNLDKEAAKRIAMGEDSIKVQKEINAAKIKELEIAIQRDAAEIRSLNAQKERLKLTQQESKEKLAQQVAEETRAAFSSINEVQRQVHLNRVAKLGEQIKEIDKSASEQMTAINEQLKARIGELEAQRDAVDDLKNSQIELNREQAKGNAEAKAKAQEAAFEKQKEQDLAEVQQMQLKTKTLANIEIDTEKMKNDILAGIDEENKLAAEKREQEHQDALKVIRERNAKFAIDTSISAFGAIQELADAFAGKSEASQRRAFKVRKAAAIAQTVVETYKAAQGAYASQIIPGDPTSPIRGAIAATIAVASGLAKVKAISSQKFEGGGAAASSGGSSGGSIPTATSNPANFNIVGNSGTNQLMEGLSNTPVQAYVVAGQVTTAQSLERNQIRTATF